MEESKLVLEIMHELKCSSKRWFIAFCVMSVIEVCTVAGFLWYISLPTESYSVEQTMQDIQESEATQMIGGEYNGENETESNL